MYGKHVSKTELAPLAPHLVAVVMLIQPFFPNGFSGSSRLADNHIDISFYTLRSNVIAYVPYMMCAVGCSPP